MPTRAVRLAISAPVPDTSDVTIRLFAWATMFVCQITVDPWPVGLIGLLLTSLTSNRSHGPTAARLA